MDNNVDFLIPNFTHHYNLIIRVVLEKETITELYDIFHKFASMKKDKISIPMSSMLFLNSYLKKKQITVENNLYNFKKDGSKIIEKYSNINDKIEVLGLKRPGDEQLNHIIDNAEKENEKINTLLISIETLINKCHLVDTYHPCISLELLYEIENYLKTNLANVYNSLNCIDEEISSHTFYLERKLREHNMA